MKIRAIKLIIDTDRGEFGFSFAFGRSLTVIRGSNSSGKSTLFNCLVYGLGMEELIGGRGEKVLPYAVKDYFLHDETRVPVTTSDVYVELENSIGRIVTLRRAIRNAERSSKLVEIFEGAVLTNDAQLVTSRPTFLFDPGSAQKEEGFFQFLESFFDYQLPGVPTTSGGMTKLYLQNIFSALVVEQKRGWTDYLANTPFYGIRDARIRVAEFLLGLGVFDLQATRAKLDTDALAIDSDWRSAYEALRQIATANNVVLEGVSASPTSVFDANSVRLEKFDGRSHTPLAEYVNVRRSEHAELGQQAEVYGSVSGETAIHQIESASNELQRLSVVHERASSNLTLQQASLSELRLLLAENVEDLERNKVAVKLRELGAQMDIEVATDHCPTCHQSVEDTLLLEIVSGPQMDLQTNIDYLDSQRRMLQSQVNGAAEEVRRSEIVVADVGGLLAAQHDFRNSLRDDVSDGATQSRALIRRQIQIELELSNLHAFEDRATSLLDSIAKIARRVEANRAARKALPKDAYSSADQAKLSLFEKYFRSNASSFGYESADIADIRISFDTLTPILSELELREIRTKVQTSLTADSSASDFVRLIWSFRLALYQTSSMKGFDGHHPGLLLMDEPGQHSMRSASQHALLQLLSGQSGLQSIVAASFDENESVFREATAGLTFVLIEWEGKVIKPLRRSEQVGQESNRSKN